MRIGEIADLAGVTVRTIRHYHQLGILPEPGRRANGYRDYTVDELVILLRLRQLTQSGLSVTQAGAVIAASPIATTDEVLDEVDASLQRQIAELEERRRRLADARAGEHVGLSKLAAALVTSPQDIPLSTLFAHLYASGPHADRLTERLSAPAVRRSILDAQRRFTAIDATTQAEELDDLAAVLKQLAVQLDADAPEVSAEHTRLLMSLADRDLNDRQREFLRRASGEVEPS